MTEPSEYRPSPGLTASAGTSEPDTLVLHEERASVGLQTVVTGYARLRKVTVTEMQTFTVPVRRETYELVTDEPRPGDVAVASAFGETPAVLTLHTEEVAFTTSTVAVETVALVPRVVAGETTVAVTTRSEKAQYAGPKPVTTGARA